MSIESCKPMQPMPAESRKLIKLIVMVRATRQTASSKLQKVSAFVACPLLLLDVVFEARNIRGNALHVLAVARRSLAEPCWSSAFLFLFLQLISWSQQEDLKQVTSLGIFHSIILNHSPYLLYLTLPAFHPSTIRGHQVVNEEVYELINVDEDDLDLDTQWLTSECYLSSSPRAVKKVRRCFIFLNN